MNTSSLPDFVVKVKHFGDVLWAAMIYFGVRALRIGPSARRDRTGLRGTVSKL
ncbi:hypothetical protein [Paenibacillus sp. Soil750]|uniref:hypothetical protein n=1 Tax=Paenibacillus sp. Soil750 TaxID=1736398 RepID=UPI000AA82B9C|nr:hypothetical protein [Paenibacillus sp. Soil750]